MEFRHALATEVIGEVGMRVDRTRLCCGPLNRVNWFILVQLNNLFTIARIGGLVW